MAGYMMLLGDCGACGRPFYSNPERVPSMRLPDGRQLIFCRDCCELANVQRLANGLEPIGRDPRAYEPADA